MFREFPASCVGVAHSVGAGPPPAACGACDIPGIETAPELREQGRPLVPRIVAASRNTAMNALEREVLFISR